MKLKDLVAEYESLTETLDLIETKFGISPSEKDIQQVIYLARQIKALGGKV